MNENIDTLKSFYHTPDGTSVCPLVVGVTGHRNIAEDCKSEMKQKIRDFLAVTIRKWQRSCVKRDEPGVFGAKDVPILVLNGMAAGADQLVAEVVLDMRDKEPGSPLRLVATLPMPYEDYREDFADSPEDLGHFEVNCGRADFVLELPLTPENRLRRARSEPLDRAPQYEVLGEYLTAHCFFLMALWDGISLDQKPGGTADVVYRKLCGAPFLIDNEITPEDVTDSEVISIQPFGSVYQIVTPREGQPKPENALQTFHLEPKSADESDANKASNWEVNVVCHPATPRQFYGTSFLAFLRKLQSLVTRRLYPRLMVSNTLRLLQAQNRDAIRWIPQCQELYGQSYDNFLHGDDEAIHPEIKARAEQSENFTYLLDHYRVYDTLAIKFQKIHQKFRNVCVWSAILGVAVSVFTFPQVSVWVFMALFIACVGEHYLFGSYTRYHRYRAVAEALRIQIFWNHAGIDKSVLDYYWNHQVGELNWLRMTMKALMIPVICAPSPDIQFVKRHWLENQYKYFKKKIKDYQLLNRKCLWPSIVCWVLVVGWFLVSSTSRVLENGTFYDWVGRLFFALIPLSGIFMYIREVNNYRDQVQKYSTMLPIYGQSRRALTLLEQHALSNDAANRQITKVILTRLGTLSLAENANWYLTPSYLKPIK